MDAKIVNIKQWKQKNHDENTSKIYLANTRAQSLAKLYYIKNGICRKGNYFWILDEESLRRHLR